MTYSQFKQLLPELVDNYRPAPDVKRQISQVSLLMVIGPSGVGKTTLIDRLGLPYVPSDTTRTIRPGEAEGVDFYFLDDYQTVVSDIKDGRFVQVAIGPAGDFYATRASSYPKNGQAVMPVVADVVPIFRRLGFKKTLSAFIVPPSFEEWQRRLSLRGLDGAQLNRRMEEARRSLSFGLSDAQTHMVLNDELEAATAQLSKLLEGYTDATRQQMAKKAAAKILNKLKLSKS